MYLQARREPFSDWLSQVERCASRITGERIALNRHNALYRSCYDVGLEPHEVAKDITLH